MTKFFNTLSRVSMAMLGNTLLASVAVSIALCGLGLASLYLFKYVDNDSPEMIQLQCVVGIERTECVNYQKKLDDLRVQREALAKRLAALKQEMSKANKQLNGLRALEDAVDKVTLFNNQKIQGTNFEVTIGTVYNKLIGINQAPEYYCYINLIEVGDINRNLYIRNNNGNIQLSAHTLSKVGVTKQALSYARSVCKPYLIEGVF
ncbi:MAG: hypothetical protein KAS59_05550 [Alphaproteobacteria bacterium]|nr:hypothetical protein [Alphaproteobacteria bacterium]